MICLSIVPVGLATSRENASFLPCPRNLFIEWASPDRDFGDLSTFNPFDCFPLRRRLPVTINF
jgi:hypothetical protein